MEETKSLQKQHNITVRDRKSMTVTGVSEIISFDELCVVFDISDSQLNVEGSCLKIESFSNDSGDVTLTGQNRFYNIRRKNTAGISQRII